MIRLRPGSLPERVSGERAKLANRSFAYGLTLKVAVGA
jgi:hypothetical protein